MEYRDIPYRRWRQKHSLSAPEIVETAAYKRVMSHVWKMVKSGKAVDMDHRVINPTFTQRDALYDVVSIKIWP